MENSNYDKNNNTKAFLSYSVQGLDSVFPLQKNQFNSKISPNFVKFII